MANFAAAMKMDARPRGARALCSGVDTHAHVIRRGYRMVKDRRYTPDYDAPVEDYLAMLDGNGLTHGLLVQPSFYGTDNACLLDALRAGGAQLRGVAVVDPDIGEHEMWSLEALGIVGVRLNLIGKPVPKFDAEPWPAFFRRAAALGWHVEVQCPAAGLPAALAPMLACGVNVVVDHFALPDPLRGVRDPAFQEFLQMGKRRPVFVKISAHYRAGAPSIALAAYPLLRDAFGVDRLLWGSDWPHTNFEHAQDYAANHDFLLRMVPDPEERATILIDNPWGLCRFEG